MKNEPNQTINLKDNIYITITGEVPKKAKMMLRSSIEFMGESESKWYVMNVSEKFKNYNGGTYLFHSAKDSLSSAIQSIAGENRSIKRLQFKIYSLN